MSQINSLSIGEAKYLIQKKKEKKKKSNQIHTVTYSCRSLFQFVSSVNIKVHKADP